MFFKNNFINDILKYEIKIYKAMKVSHPLLSKPLENNIKLVAKCNFQNALSKIETK